ncbi:MAG TPA: secondary thiamine-phosphate synthase enzyme YjbQ [Methylomirabilota bacterium]|jgi:secondary thiamine-phosphate synthase enzyme|nr:secondary thiamine-phosphate synthase enzyme YjbQ [Methylomirabilota bacterium]
MKVYRDTVTIRTEENQQFVDVTKHVQEVIGRSGIRNGTLIVNALHTTVAVFVNEFQSALIDDLGVLLQRLVPRRDGYFHDDPRYSDCDRANGHAHLRSILLGRSIALGVAEGEPLLGRYQSVILAELDGPRERRLQVQIVGE